MEIVEEKNPANFWRQTPLHLAAKRGHLDVCRIILENVKDKNPVGLDGWTPLDFAAENGHLEICELILEKMRKNNPKDTIGMTEHELTLISEWLKNNITYQNY